MNPAEGGAPALAAPRLKLWLQRGLPVAVTVGALVWLLSRFDLSAVVAAVDGRVIAVMVPALLGYGAATLVLEALSIRRVLDAPPPSFTLFTAARIKCASYLLAIINYTLGGAGLAVLLRQRAGISLAQAASVVGLIAIVDLVVVLGFGSLGAVSAAQAGGAGLRVGLALAIIAGLVGGVAVLRAPFSLGPLERLRALAVFAAPRHTPLPRLLELFGYRCLFSVCFLSIAGAAFVAFDVEPPAARFVVGIAVLAVVGALPIAVSGLGTGQVAAVYLFRDFAPEETILAMSLVLSFGLILLRLAMGLVFAREFAQQAFAQARDAV
jgi:uncharacterized membrane protein YbhN (UPF0104 family)